jgi:hypothetical protein
MEGWWVDDFRVRKMVFRRMLREERRESYSVGIKITDRQNVDIQIEDTKNVDVTYPYLT